MAICGGPTSTLNGMASIFSGLLRRSPSPAIRRLRRAARARCPAVRSAHSHPWFVLRPLASRFLSKNEIKCGVDERDVGERLREITREAFRLRIVFLR